MSAVYKDLFQAVECVITSHYYRQKAEVGADPEMDEEADFWLDPETVLFETSPEDEEVYAATYSSLKAGKEQMADLISDELIETYLSTRDFSVIFGVDDTEDREVIMVAAVDKSTGMALMKADNLIDPAALEKAAKIAKANTTAEELEAFNYNYRLISPKDSNLTTAQKANSQRRLTAILSDIDMHVLGRYVGSEVQVRDDL